jgi:hypothetical protein
MDPGEFTVVKSKRKPRPPQAKPEVRSQSSSGGIPQAILKQQELSKKHKYKYRVLSSNGNVENSSTFYVATGVAHHEQVLEIFQKAIQEATAMPEVFGNDFECDVIVNLLRRRNPETGKMVYSGIAYVDVNNPKLYFALLGLNIDGSERAEYYEDPEWVPTESNSWADQVCPTLRRELPPILTLPTYEYDEDQKEHLNTDATHGNVNISPAFKPSVSDDVDPCVLFVQGVPTKNLNFLYEIFARYARTPKGDELYPKISIKETRNGSTVAFVRYAHEYDAGFAIVMLRKIRALFSGQEIIMPVCHAEIR